MSTETVLSDAQRRLLVHAQRIQAMTERLAANRRACPGSSDAAEDAHVYYIQRGNNGPIKIGCSADVHRRFSELQTASAEPLRLLGIEGLGGYGMEARLHRKFAADRLNGEWFCPSELLMEIAADSYGYVQ